MNKILIVAILLVTGCSNHAQKPVYTQVSFLYNIKRGDLPSQFKRSFEYYLEYFNMLLESDCNLIVFGGLEMKDYVWQRRKEHNTVFVLREIEQFKQMWYYPLTEKNRQSKLKDPSFPYKHYPQFALEYYNLIMFSKLYVMAQALKHDKFNSDILIWTDGGYMHQFNINVYSPTNLVTEFYQLMQPQWMFLTYTDDSMYLGFERGSSRYLERPVKSDEVILASNFGGVVEALRDVKCAFENLLRIVLENGDMNSDESVLSIMPIKFPYLFPNTDGLYLLTYHKKIKIQASINRKPEYSRLFRGSFDGQGNIDVVENRILTKFFVESRTGGGEWLPSNSTRQQVLQGLGRPIDILKINGEVVGKQSLRLVLEKVALYRRLFLREGCFLMVILVLYFLMLRSSRDLRKRAEKRSLDSEASTIVSFRPSK